MFIILFKIAIIFVMKKETLQKHTKIANDIMFYIYTHIDIDINLAELSQMVGLSTFHMHRVFKNVFGKNIYESIKSIRLQKAASLLLTNAHSTISEIAHECGYSSHSSFIKAFKERFGFTPKEWRNGAYKEYSNSILSASNIPLEVACDFSNLRVEIVKMEAMQSYYIRNKGYNDEVKKRWQKLYTLVLSNEIQEYQQVALLHDNPTITPLDECQYIACLVTDEAIDILDKKIPKFTISGGVYAKFRFQGYGDDLLQLIHWVNHVWLIENDYETTTKPSYIIYHQNNYLNENNYFDVSYYISVDF